MFTTSGVGVPASGGTAVSMSLGMGTSVGVVIGTVVAVGVGRGVGVCDGLAVGVSLAGTVVVSRRTLVASDCVGTPAPPEQESISAPPEKGTAREFHPFLSRYAKGIYSFPPKSRPA